MCYLRVLGTVEKEPNSYYDYKKYKLLIIIIYLMIPLLFLYDPLYASSHDLESDYPRIGLKDENYPTFQIVTANQEMIFYIYPRR